MDDEQRESCDRCEWRDWETGIWAITCFISFILGMTILANVTDHGKTDTNPRNTTTTSIHRR